MLNNLLNWLQGKKTYFVAAGMLVYAGLGWLLKYLTPQQAADIVFAALSMIGFRSALNKVSK